MKTDSYYLFLKKYTAEHPADFVASHETNNNSIPERILQTGLRVSHSPYSRKIQHCLNSDGSIDLERAFVATMFVLDSNAVDKNKFYLETPTAPMVINIPSSLLKIIGAKTTDDSAHEFFSKFGYEERPTENEGRCGKVTPLETSKGANIRLLPTCFIAGYFDPVKEVFIENDKHFSKLPQAEQEKIIKEYTQKFELLNQSQPQ